MTPTATGRRRGQGQEGHGQEDHQGGRHGGELTAPGARHLARRGLRSGARCAAPRRCFSGDYTVRAASPGAHHHPRPRGHRAGRRRAPSRPAPASSRWPSRSAGSPTSPCPTDAEVVRANGAKAAVTDLVAPGERRSDRPPRACPAPWSPAGSCCSEVGREPSAYPLLCDARLRVRLPPPDGTGSRAGRRQGGRPGRPPPGPGLRPQLPAAAGRLRRSPSWPARSSGSCRRWSSAASSTTTPSPGRLGGLDRLALLALSLAFADAGPQHPPALAVGPHRRGPDLRPALGPLRPRPGHAAGVLHPHPDRLADQPDEQRRHGRPAGLHRHPRQRRCRTSSTSPSPCSSWSSSSGGSPCWSCSSSRCSCSRPGGSGRKMQKLTRESFQLDAVMNAGMTERFNVSGALLVKLFGHPRRESAEFAERAGPGARHRHPHGHVRPPVLLRPRPAGRGRHGGRLLARHPPGHRRDDHPRHAHRPGRLRHPHLQPAHPADQRPGRHHDVDRAASSGSSRCSTPPGPSRTRPGAYDLVDPAGPHRVRRRVVPLPGAVDRVDRLPRGRRRRRRSPTTRRAPS